MAGDYFDYCKVEDNTCKVYWDANSDGDTTADVEMSGFQGVSCDFDFLNNTCDVTYLDDCSVIINDDGKLTPPNSSAGTVPATVTTNEYGVGSFNLIYPKASAVWIIDEVVATTYVLGSETKSSKEMILPWLEGDEPYLPSSSPYNGGLF